MHRASARRWPFVVGAATLISTLYASTPAISGVSVSRISASGATISWSTNVPADSQVMYGVTAAYGSATALNTALVTSHSVVISGLTSSTTCHYQVQSRDSGGSLGTLADFTFTTAPNGPGVPLPTGQWTMVLTKGVPAATNGWEQLAYAPAVKRSIMLSQYHQRGSEPNETLVAYNFETNSWEITDMGGMFHTENIGEGGETQGYFDFNPGNSTLLYHCCTTGSNQSEQAFHTWWYDLPGQSGRDKHTSPKPNLMALQPGGVFDVAHGVFVTHGGASYVGTWTYNPIQNAWHKMSPSGTPPDPSLILPGAAYSTVEHKVYLYGGLGSAGYSSDLYVYDAGANTWTRINPLGGVKPPGRYRHAFAYDSTNNIFLMYGGQVGTTVLNDTWAYNPATNAWAQLNTPSPGFPTVGPFARMSYDSDHNVFVLANKGWFGYYGGDWRAYAFQTWLFRYAGSGPNPGALDASGQPMPGALNRFQASWAKDPVIAGSNSSLYMAWSELSSPFDTSTASAPHIYVSQYSAGAWTPLGPASGISGDINEAHAPSMVVANGAPSVSWYEGSSTQPTHILSSTWTGAGWSGTAVGTIATSSITQGRSQLANIAGVPYVAFLETNKGVAPQRTDAYVKARTGSAWNLVGGSLNRNAGSGSTVDSISITGNGTTPYVAWTEYAHLGGTSTGDADSIPQAYAAVWNGTQWTPLGGSLNMDPGNWAYEASIAYVGGQPYVAWTERTQTGNAQLYVKTWNGTAWVVASGGALNVNGADGWAYRPSLVADAAGGALYVAWVEQVLGQKAQVYVYKYAAGSWTPLGSSLNMDPIQGSAQRASLTLYNGQPAVAWSEVNLGQLRQIYVKAWTGSSWMQLAGIGPNADTTPPSAPSSVSATAVSANQINVTWAQSTDIVGTAGYYIYRNGVQVGNVNSTLSYQDATLNPSTTYTYAVAAYDVVGNVSAKSANVAATTQGLKPLGIAALTLAPANTVGGASTTGNTVSLTGPAPAGGAIVLLASSNPSASAPASVAVAAGATTSAAFTITTSTVASSTTVTISATYGGTATATLTVNPIMVSAVTLSPASVLGGGSTTANTVTLNAPAPAGGAVVSLSSSDPAATVPASVTVAAGAKVSPVFTIKTNAVSASTNVTISATYNAVVTSAVLTVSPTALSAVTLSPTSVVGVASTTANKVILTAPAPSGGTTIALSSSDPSATVPAFVTIQGGSTSGTFSINTSPVTTVTTVTISATYNGVIKAATLIVNPPAVASIALSPVSVIGGVSTTANTVTLNGPAPAGGAVVTLSSVDPAAIPPASVNIPAGATTSAAFTIATTRVSAITSVRITATYNGSAKSATLTVSPLQLSSVTVAPTTVVGGVALLGKVMLNTAAPAGGITVALSDSDSSASTPATVTIGAGTTSASFPITTQAVAANTIVTVSATYNGATKTTSFTEVPVALVKLNVPAVTVVGGLAVTSNNVSLNGPAPVGGIVVTLASSDPSVIVPASVTVPAGASASSVFSINTSPVTASTTVTISASYNGVTKTDPITITPPAASSVAVSPLSVVGGVSANGKVMLNGPAPAGGATVTLTSSDPSVTVPLSVAIPAGATASSPFAITTSAVSANLVVSISASYNSTAVGKLTVTPVALNKLILSPTSVKGGNSTSANNVTLNGPAPPGGIVITLSSSGPSVTTPASITVPAGATTSPTFPITTSAVTGTTTVTVSAAYAGVTKAATLSITP